MVQTTITIGDIINVLLVAALVVTTIYYAIQTRVMAKETERTRKVQVLPKLTLSLNFIGPTYATAALRNVGVGPALDISVNIMFGDRESRKWTQGVMVPGELKQFILPDINGQGSPDIPKAAETFHKISITGSYCDIFKEQHKIEDSIDLREYWNMLKAASVRFEFEDVHEIRKSIEKISEKISSIAVNLKQSPK